MAHFAKLGVNNKVLQIEVLNNSDMLNASGVEDETIGQQRLQEIHGWPAQMWIKTSYNTRGNKYYNADGSEGDQSKKLRGNYAGIGYIYDEENDMFFNVQPHASWTKNTSTASWDSPINYPTVLNDGADPMVWYWVISWNETAYQADNSKGWKGKKQNADLSNHADAAKTYDWNGSAWVEA